MHQINVTYKKLTSQAKNHRHTHTKNQGHMSKTSTLYDVDCLLVVDFYMCEVDFLECISKIKVTHKQNQDKSKKSRSYIKNQVHTYKNQRRTHEKSMSYMKNQGNYKHQGNSHENQGYIYQKSGGTYKKSK